MEGSDSSGRGRDPTAQLVRLPTSPLSGETTRLAGETNPTEESWKDEKERNMAYQVHQARNGNILLWDGEDLVKSRPVSFKVLCSLIQGKRGLSEEQKEKLLKKLQKLTRELDREPTPLSEEQSPEARVQQPRNPQPRPAPKKSWWG